MVVGVPFRSVQLLAGAEKARDGAPAPPVGAPNPKSSRTTVMISAIGREPAPEGSLAPNCTVFHPPYCAGMPEICAPNPLTRVGTLLIARIVSRNVPVGPSVSRSFWLPVPLPGWTERPETVAPGLPRAATVTARPAGAVVAVTVAELPVTPPRLGSAEFAGAVALPMAVTNGPPKAGTGANVAPVTSTSSTGEETTGVPDPTAHDTVKLAPPTGAPGTGAADRISACRPRGWIVTPAGAPDRAQVRPAEPVPVTVARAVIRRPTPSSAAGVVTAVTTNGPARWMTGSGPTVVGGRGPRAGRKPTPPRPAINLTTPALPTVRCNPSSSCAVPLSAPEERVLPACCVPVLALCSLDSVCRERTDMITPFGEWSHYR